MRRSFETPRKRAAPQDDGGVCGLDAGIAARCAASGVRRALSLAEARRIEARSAIILLQGTIYYADIWGDEGATDFDGRYEPDSKRFNIAHKLRKKTN